MTRSGNGTCHYGQTTQVISNGVCTSLMTTSRASSTSTSTSTSNSSTGPNKNDARMAGDLFVSSIVGKSSIANSTTAVKQQLETDENSPLIGAEEVNGLRTK